MKVTEDNRISITPNEAARIIGFLDTLHAMGGALDEAFTEHCDKAGRVADRLRCLKYSISKTLEL